MVDYRSRQKLNASAVIKERTLLEADLLVTLDVRDSVCYTSVILNILLKRFQIQGLTTN